LQLAAGFLGYDYPAAYSTLVGQVVGTRLNKGETRTDWRQRPLSQKQLQYAAQDVEHLAAIHAHLKSELEKAERLQWYEQEVDAWQTQLEETETQPTWLRMSGLSRLNRRSLAIVQKLSEWRDGTAASENRSPRRILPDDLLIEIAKRGEADLSRLKAIRGLQNRVAARFLDSITAQVAAAMKMNDDELPSKIRAAPTVNLGILGQFMQTGLNLICVRERIAPGLVANAQDVRDLAARMMGLLENGDPQKLDSGWRREIVGKSFERLLNGKLALRIANLDKDQPLELVEWNGSE
jgi:ribonuclease D